MKDKTHATTEQEMLNERELEEVAAYPAHLKQRTQQESTTVDEAQLEALYAEFAEEDSALAEEDIAAYAEALTRED